MLMNTSRSLVYHTMDFRSLMHNARARRGVLLSTYIVLLFAVVAATMTLVALFVSSSHLKFSDRLAAIGDVVTSSTLLLALIAALVALQAYAAATGLPDLKLQVWFDSSRRNYPVFRASRQENGWLRTTTPERQTSARVSLRNCSTYSARNPALVVRLRGMFLHNVEQLADWSPVEFIDTLGATVLQWDGGVAYSIHGSSIRRLPTLNFAQVSYVPEWGEPSIEFEMLADGGYRREVSIRVGFRTNSNLSQSTDSIGGDKPSDWI
jgi:hypothetical protein